MDPRAIVTVLRVIEIMSSITSKGDQRVSSIMKARNTFLIVKIINFAFLLRLTVIFRPSSYSLMIYPLFS